MPAVLSDTVLPPALGPVMTRIRRSRLELDVERHDVPGVPGLPQRLLADLGEAGVEQRMAGREEPQAVPRADLRAGRRRSGRRSGRDAWSRSSSPRNADVLAQGGEGGRGASSISSIRMRRRSASSSSTDCWSVLLVSTTWSGSK